MSKQKKLLYRIIQESDRHMTAEEIFTAARREMPSLALGTVYRNLGKMIEEGLIGRVEMPAEAPARYDRQSKPHPHLVCEQCGSVEDIFVQDDFLAPLIRSLPGKYTGYDMNIYCICPACAEAEA